MYDVGYTLLTQAKCTVKIWAAGNGRSYIWAVSGPDFPFQFTVKSSFRKRAFDLFPRNTKLSRMFETKKFITHSLGSMGKLE